MNINYFKTLIMLLILLILNLYGHSTVILAAEFSSEEERFLLLLDHFERNYSTHYANLGDDKLQGYTQALYERLSGIPIKQDRLSDKTIRDILREMVPLPTAISDTTLQDLTHFIEQSTDPLSLRNTVALVSKALPDQGLDFFTSLYNPFDLCYFDHARERWLKAINDYTTTVPHKDHPEVQVKMIGAHTIDPNESVKTLIDHFLPNQHAFSALYEGVSSSESKDKRKIFINYIFDNCNQKSPHFDNPSAPITIPTITDILGKIGLQLFKEALEEERNTQNYRNAVFLSSVKTYHGYHFRAEETGASPAQKHAVWIAGPSSSGKTYSLKNILKEQILIRNAPDESAPPPYPPPSFITIDGAIDRELSQMRQLIVRCALSLGYPGISDLHEHTFLQVKEYVKEAAMRSTNPTLHLAIPNTFTEKAEVIVHSILNLPTEDMSKLAENHFQQMLINIKEDKTSTDSESIILSTDPADENTLRISSMGRFQTRVTFQGERRAFLAPKEVLTLQTLEGNPLDLTLSYPNQALPIESKIYEKDYFA
ncbi:MAG: hypothetical protein HQK50_09840, partial [Oligoflexia bacterium]|nr:hypothetical protein [Oligoflexia bacterium]